MIRIGMGIICIAFGLFGWGGQLISVIHFRKAQQWGLQEKDEGADPVFLNAERTAALWDSLVLWTLIVAGIFMLSDHSTWPVWALVAGGVYVDTGGREAAKYSGLLKSNVRTGHRADIRKAVTAYVSLIAVGLAVIIYAVHNLLFSIP